MGDIKQTNFRIDEDKANAFRKFCDENNLSQATGFDYLIQILELDQAKSIVSNREMEISEFELHAKALVRSFINSLEICNNTEERVRQEFITLLDSKDRMISDYQSEIDKLKDKISDDEYLVQQAFNNQKEAKAEAQNLKQQLELVNEQYKSCTENNNALITSVARAEEIAKKYEHEAHLYAGVMTELEEYKKKYENAQAAIDKIKGKHDDEINMLKQTHEYELKQKEIENKLEINKANDAIRTEYQNKIDELKSLYENRINKLNEDITARVDLYQSKLDGAHERLDELRSRYQEEIDKYRK